MKPVHVSSVVIILQETRASFDVLFKVLGDAMLGEAEHK